MNKIATDILIVGGGPAGLSAAVAASWGREAAVVVVDDNPHLGGQIWRAELGKTQSPDAAKLIERIESKRIKLISNAQVFDAVGESNLAAEANGRRCEIVHEKLIIATGGRERFLPFPGWTLPGVFGPGGLQALVKGGFSVGGKRLIVAGSGPLLLAVADYLKQKGASVAAILEQTPARKLNQFTRGLWRYPVKIGQGIRLKKRLLGVPYVTDSWIVSAAGKNKLETVTLLKKGRTETMDCDFLACGFHLVPNTELASLLNCDIKNGFVTVNEFQETSEPNIYCAGEPTGIGGLEASLVEGRIAGLAAVGDTNGAKEHFRDRDKTQKFAEDLERAFVLRDELRTLPEADTFVCRCEDVSFERLRKFPNWREAKLQTRCGMGACQGRVCGPATEFLFGWKTSSVRPPIFPVRLENL